MQGRLNGPWVSSSEVLLQACVMDIGAALMQMWSHWTKCLNGQHNKIGDIHGFRDI